MYLKEHALIISLEGTKKY